MFLRRMLEPPDITTEPVYPVVVTLSWMKGGEEKTRETKDTKRVALDLCFLLLIGKRRKRGTRKRGRKKMFPLKK